MSWPWRKRREEETETFSPLACRWFPHWRGRLLTSCHPVGEQRVRNTSFIAQQTLQDHTHTHTHTHMKSFAFNSIKTIFKITYIFLNKKFIIHDTPHGQIHTFTLLQNKNKYSNKCFSEFFFHNFHKNIKQNYLFNIKDNKKCFVSTKSASEGERV